VNPPARIIRIAVILHTHSTLTDWQSASRSPCIVRGKRIMALIARKHLGLSYPEIARLCEWGSHATAYDAVRQARKCEQITQDADEILASVVEAAA
jgi:chromosomal replication initiation ATPase DnaA